MVFGMKFRLSEESGWEAQGEGGGRSDDQEVSDGSD